MKKIVTTVSALVLALGVLSGCGEKKEEAPKAEAATQAVADAAKATGDAAKAVGDAAVKTAESTAQAAGDAAKAVGDAAAKTAESAAQAAGDAAAKAAETVAQAAAPAGPVDGEKVYKGLCFGCHDQGVMNAPKFGDKGLWAPRIATGIDALYNSSLHGKNAMPAKGGNPALSDAEVKAAVDYMVAHSK
ncbi:MAG: hypothetical protein RI964_845 [Pseudomonadota bacterium]